MVHSVIAIAITTVAARTRIMAITRHAHEKTQRDYQTLLALSRYTNAVYLDRAGMSHHAAMMLQPRAAATRSRRWANRYCVCCPQITAFFN
ncbi:MAG TPA: hypothetical protein VK430_07945, partial [Xanthobacteraceae bacterium]|nr:hypothetical protein [Xanthobacteraceae bacterium]